MKQSKNFFERAKKSIAGGVNSPVRAFRAVGGNPIFVSSASGPFLFSEDGNRYIDYIGSWGPMIAGHANPRILSAVEKALPFGLSFGAPTVAETLLAEKVKTFFPAIEKLRFSSSGTEATMSAIRLARGFTKRDLIVKFSGCYHGHSDSVLIDAGSGGLTFGVPSSPGIPDDIVKNTLVLPFNDLEATKSLFLEYGSKIAGLIIEPIAGNMNMVLPEPKFLENVSALCKTHGAVLIFDEVMTGFRVSAGGAQKLLDIKPDLTCLGKIIGGGMPVGAFGGRANIMNALSPDGPIYQAGTLSGNPVAMAAGNATLTEILSPNFFVNLENQTKTLVRGMKDRAKEAKIDFTMISAGGMFGLFFLKEPPKNLNEVKNGNKEIFSEFFNEMLKQGVYFAPSMFEAGFVSSTHSQEIINETLDGAEIVFSKIKKKFGLKLK
tara:strand:- start:2300 stop:3604 length:1305 start_codon:yes stop_codon:yes gene_type:complete